MELRTLLNVFRIKVEALGFTEKKELWNDMCWKIPYTENEQRLFPFTSFILQGILGVCQHAHTQTHTSLMYPFPYFTELDGMQSI